MTTRSLDDRVAVVTGTTSGLGLRFAEALDAAGARLVLASRRHDADVALADRLREALPVRTDVRDPAHREALVTAALERFGRIDILVNNAGLASSGPAEDESLQVIHDLLETNLVAVFALCQLVSGQMFTQFERDGRGGVIVNIASPAATVSLDRYGLAGYGASKAGVVALTRELAAQWGRRGIRVNAIAPHFFPAATSGYLRDPELVSWLQQRLPLGRVARIEEIDGPLLFLCSDDSSFVTGQTLYVDGGWSAY